MEKFIGTKLVKAIPMTRGFYNTYREWDIPQDENPNDEGFLVEYMGGGESNHPKHEGYISWSPKKQFADAYRPTSGMSFGLAIEAMKKGHKVAQKSWEHGMWDGVYIICNPGDDVKTPSSLEVYGIDASSGGEELLHAKISSSSMLADDWMIVE